MFAPRQIAEKRVYAGLPRYVKVMASESRSRCSNVWSMERLLRPLSRGCCPQSTAPKIASAFTRSLNLSKRMLGNMASTGVSIFPGRWYSSANRKQGGIPGMFAQRIGLAFILFHRTESRQCFADSPSGKQVRVQSFRNCYRDWLQRWGCRHGLRAVAWIETCSRIVFVQNRARRRSEGSS